MDAVLDLGTALASFSGKADRAQRALQAFVTAYGALPARCVTLAAAGDAAALAQVAHQIKGAAGVLGARRLGAAADALEQAQRDGLTAAVLTLAPPFIEQFEAALAAMRAAQTAAPAAAAAPDAARALQLAGRVAPLLADGDFAGRALLDELEAALAGSTYLATARAIGAAFDELETERAASLLERLTVELGAAR